MRSKRLRKFRRQFPVAIFLVKLVLIWYLVVFSISYLTSGTAAHFYDAKGTASNVYAGYWADGWDGSSLSFIENGNTTLKSCDPVEITKEIQNIGNGDMAAGSTYDIYYVENGNPEKHGAKLDLPEGEGKIPALNSEDAAEMKHLAQQPGVYAFLVQQPEGHPDGENIWSKWVIVNCPPGQEEQDVEKETQKGEEPEMEEGQNENTESNEDLNEESNKNTESKEDLNKESNENSNEVDEAEEPMEEEPENETETEVDDGKQTETEQKEQGEAGEAS